MNQPLVQGLIAKFLPTYDAKAKDLLWQKQSAAFRNFWSNRIMAATAPKLSDEECDVIVRILDRNGKGNTKECEAVAKAMVAQGAWRRMFQSFQSEKELAQ